MDDTRNYRIDDDDWTIPDDEREYSAAGEDEVPVSHPTGLRELTQHLSSRA